MYIADGASSRVSKGCPRPPLTYSCWSIEYQLKADVLVLAQLVRESNVNRGWYTT